MKIYRRLSQFGSKLAIILQEPLRSTIPFIPPCVTREKYFTARCAKPLQAIAAYLTAVYHSCAGYSIVKILCPLLIEEWQRRFVALFSKTLWLCTSRCIWWLFILPSTHKELGGPVMLPFSYYFVEMRNWLLINVLIFIASIYKGMGEGGFEV